MNLQSFINYRNTCPLCSSDLCLSFHSKRRQKHEIHKNRFIVKFEMVPISKKYRTYTVGYSFGLNDNSFIIEFYNEFGLKMEHISLSILQQFNTFNKNLGKYTFYKYCDKCNNYSYVSNDFFLNKSINNVDVVLHKEYFCFFIPKENKYKRYQLINDYNCDISLLGCFDSNYIGDVKYKLTDSEMMQLNLIKFVSKEDTLSRIKKLMLFS